MEIEINDLSNSELIKFLMTRKCIEQQRLWAKMGEIKGKQTNPNNFGQKLKINSLRLDELQMICKILGYKIIIKED